MNELDVIVHEGEVLKERTATLIASRLPGFVGNARLYRLEPMISYSQFEDGEEFRSVEVQHLSRYVIVSGVANAYACETYIFPASPEGEVVDWGELPGSFQGRVDHEEALNRAGYEVR